MAATRQPLPPSTHPPCYELEPLTCGVAIRFAPVGHKALQQPHGALVLNPAARRGLSWRHHSSSGAGATATNANAAAMKIGTCCTMVLGMLQQMGARLYAGP